jgi:glutamine cyclotransferase
MLLSSGWYGKSKFVVINFDFEKCVFNQVFSHKMDDKYFAEGLTMTQNGTIFQLVWKKGKVHVWTIKSSGIAEL